MGDRVSDLAELTELPADDDWLVVVDVSDTTQSAQGTTKKISFANLVSMLGALLAEQD